MLETGAITKDAGKAGARGEARARRRAAADEPQGQYFKEQVRRELVERFGWQRVYQGGLRVFSTIDMPMQMAAELRWPRAWRRSRSGARGTIAQRRARRRSARPRRRAQPPLQAALVALDPGDRPRPGDGRRARLRAEPFQPRGAGASVSRDRRSSRSSTRPRSKRATRRRRSSTPR